MSHTICQSPRRQIALTLITTFLYTLFTPLLFAARSRELLGSPDVNGSKSFVIEAQADFIRQVSLVANDVVYSSSTGKLYASVPSSSGSNGNRIATIDPSTGNIDNSVFIGSEPNLLAMSDDGNTLYASLDGAFAVRRFDTQTQTPGLQFSVGQDSFFGRYRVNDLVVAPGNPNLVAIARHYPGTSPPEAGVAVFDDGVQRPQAGPGHTEGSDYLSFSASAAKLYGGGFYSSLKTMTIDANGVTVTATAPFSVGSRIKFNNGMIFSSTGQVINPDAGTLLGTFSGATSNAFVADSSVGRAYYVVGSQFGGGSLTLKAFAINTFLPVGSLEIPGATGDPRTIVRWGANGLALRTSTNQLFIIQTSLIPSAEPIPTPTPVSSPTPTPSPVPFDTFVKQVSLPTNDLVYDQPTQKLYASVPSRAGNIGNSITAIDPATGNLGNSVFVGSEPTHLAQADDGQTMYVELEGASAVRRFNTATQTAGQQFAIGLEGFFGVFSLSDLAVAPGNPGIVAVARQYRGVSPSQAGVVVFENGVQRPNAGPGHLNGSDVLTFSNSPSTLYGGGYSGLSTMTVDVSGVTVNNTRPFISGTGITFHNGLIYGASGEVINPTTGAIVGTFSRFGDFFSNAMVVDPANGRVFFLAQQGSSAVIRAYDINTFVPIGSVTIQGAQGFSFSVSSLVRWGTNGLAFSIGDKVFIVQTSLVNSSDPVPVPTPTPSPTPSPSPTYVPTFVRRVELLANDLVHSQATQALYASVPSSVGASGNSITKITPETAVVGPAIFVGSEPNKLAISDNGQTLYVNFDGANAVRRFDVPSQTPGLQFSTSSQAPIDMEVVPGSPDSVAISRGIFSGVAIYDNGVQRPNTGSGSFYAVGPIEFGSAPTTLYGYDSFSSGFELVKFTVDSSGVTPTTVTNNLLTGYITGLKFANGLLYSGSGRVADPEARQLAGTFDGLGGPNSLVVDSANNRAFYIFTSGSNMVLKAYDTNTFLPLGSVTLPGVSGNPGSLVRWGVNGLAFNTVNSFSGSPNVSSVYLLQTALVSTAAPIPTGLQLSSNTLFVQEGSANLLVTVSRTGDVSSSNSVNYATTDGTATAGVDYTSATGTLTFAPGELSKTISIPIIGDNLYEGANETFNLTLSNPTGGAVLSAPNTAVVTIQEDDQKPYISLPFVFPVTEGNSGTKNVTLNVSLSNPTVQIVTVDFTTENGTAIAGSDYVATSGTLTFPSGTTSMPIQVTVNGDTDVEPDETFLVRLSNATNVSFISNSQQNVTIADDDSPAPNPVDQPTFFVSQHYVDFLNRAPDAAGLAFWRNQITSCGTDTACIELRRINVSAAFFLSIEFQQTGYLVYRMYKAAYGNLPNAPVPVRFEEFLPDTQQIGQGVVVGQTGWEQLLENNKQAFAANFVARVRFTNAYPPTLTPTQFVDALFTNAGVTPLVTDRTAAINEFGVGASNTADVAARARAVRRVAENSTLAQQEFNRAFVLMQYFGYLRRNPNDAPELGLNFDGYNFWLGKLNQFNGNFINAEMVKAFILSGEYRQRFGP
jgi:sugar lactone lactonase YvrE